MHYDMLSVFTSTFEESLSNFYTYDWTKNVRIGFPSMQTYLKQKKRKKLIRSRIRNTKYFLLA